MLDENCRNLQELIERSTPKKPKMKVLNEAEPWYCGDHFVEREVCPSCWHKLLDKNSYCPICGQAIDWNL